MNVLTANTGISAGKIIEAAADAVFNDGSTSSERVCGAYGTSTPDSDGYNLFRGNYPNLTFAQLFKNDKSLGAFAALPGGDLQGQIFFNTNAPHIKNIAPGRQLAWLLTKPCTPSELLIREYKSHLGWTLANVLEI